MSEFSRNMAFVIGINNYTNGISPLQNAENDAKQLVELLRKQHGYQVWVCLNELATLKNLNRFLDKILPEQVGENDRLLFYFAGHGIALNGDDGPAGYLIPQDAQLNATQTYLPMAKLQESLEKLPCRHFLGILDCCFAGAFRWSSTRDLLTAPEVIHKERYDRFITDPAWQVITSAAYDQKALDAFNFNTERGQKGNHSPFAAALIEALAGKADIYPPATNEQPAGDGVITATELYLYLRDAVEPATEESRHRQTPGIHPLKKHDKGEYIFLSPGHPLNLPAAPPLDPSQNPYRGLASFDEKHSSLFFGRTLLVEKLDYFVKTHPLTVVLGASGSGKSSLVKAGLIPKLRQDNTEKWCILPPIRPGETPLQALNNVLCNATLPNVEPRNPEQNLAMTIDVWAKDNPNSKLLLFIDQSEEIITLCQNLDERKEFFQQILTAINGHRDKLRVVLTLRSDFEPQVRDAGLKFVPTDYNLGNTVLKNRWHSRRFIVPGMTRGELKEAIEKPAQARVMYFQPHELVEELINEVADMPGALPLLSFALSELYLKYLKRQRQAQYRGITIDRALTQADYMELGGVMRSLTQRADEEYQALVNENPVYDQVIRHVMLRMVALTGGELARRRVPLSELEYPPEKKDLVEE
ncbi:MAG: caspase family protein, partial [Moorea sp. SIO2I5]|nr:caspase family protein [Moorena sp. SIO2I5]